jgi:hypothetical protein
MIGNNNNPDHHQGDDLTSIVTDKVKEGYHDTMKKLDGLVGNEDGKVYHEEKAEKLKQRYHPHVYPEENQPKPSAEQIGPDGSGMNKSSGSDLSGNQMGAESKQQHDSLDSFSGLKDTHSTTHTKDPVNLSHSPPSVNCSVASAPTTTSPSKQSVPSTAAVNPVAGSGMNKSSGSDLSGNQMSAESKQQHDSLDSFSGLKDTHSTTHTKDPVNLSHSPPSVNCSVASAPTTTSPSKQSVPSTAAVNPIAKGIPSPAENTNKENSPLNV